MEVWRTMQKGGTRWRVKRLPLYLSILVCLILGSCIFGVQQYATYSGMYQQDMSLANSGMQHLQKAEAFLRTLQKNPFDAYVVQQAKQEFALGSRDMTQLRASLQSLPEYATSLPIYGKRLSAALRLVPLAITLAQTGVTSCVLLTTLIAKFHAPLTIQGPLLTQNDITTMASMVHKVKTGIDTAENEIHGLQPTDMEVEPRIKKALSKLFTDVPSLQQNVSGVEQLLTVAPLLLGIAAPASYLIEVLDSTELRPGGGFIGNYGTATISGGRLASVHVTDSYLLDTLFLRSGNKIQYPATYTWFPLAQASWSLRDSNLDADFPTAAKYALQNYKLEGGTDTPVGVIAITPAFIQQILAITGPISIPEYGEVVTAQNLIDRIHYYQLEKATVGTGNSTIAAPDGNSSQRKHFVSLLGERLVERIHQLPSSTLPKIWQLTNYAFHAKDVQIYLNSSVAEQYLAQNHLDSAVQASTDDGLMVVDANVSRTKANSLIANTLSDQVSIDRQGNATHKATLTYAWSTQGKLYGAMVYRDYVRIYVPTNSSLLTQNGWQFQGKSTAFGHQVWAGWLTLEYGQTTTITLTWTVPHIAKNTGGGWHYLYQLQKQAGTHWLLHFNVTLPLHASVMRAEKPLVQNAEGVGFTQAVLQDVDVGVDYIYK